MDQNVVKAIDKMAHGENITRIVNADEATRLQFSQEVWNMGDNARTAQGAGGSTYIVKDVAGASGHKSEVAFSRDKDGNRVVVDVQDVLNSGLMRDIYDTPQQEAMSRARRVTGVSLRGDSGASGASGGASGTDAVPPPPQGEKQAYEHCMDASAESRRKGDAVWHVDASECAAETGYSPNRQTGH